MRIEDFYNTACARASETGQGLFLAVEDGYSTVPGSASDIFLSVDAIAAHNPDATFRNSQLAELLDDAPLPTVGVLADANPRDATTTTDAGDNPNEDAETWALRTGYARDRVIAYARCKRAALQARATSGSTREERRLKELPAAIKDDLHECEARVLQTPTRRCCSAEYNSDKRAAWSACDMPDRQPTLLETGMTTGVTRHQIEGLASSVWEMTADALDNHARDGKLGTERFVSLVFPPHDHESLEATNATGGGVRVSQSERAYPAYVTLHNSKGAIEHLPATATEARPNSVVVSCAATLLSDLHALSAKAGRNHLLVAHNIDLQ